MMADRESVTDFDPQRKRISRYPGVRPFGDDDTQRQLFKGRDTETYELVQLVLAERLVLIFARSGIGKSSLINAGLLEPLRDRDYFPMVVRVSGSAGNPVGCLYDGVKAAAEKAVARGQIEYEPPESDWNRASLWHFFKTLELWKADKLLTPVLVIDQFEELFTLSSVEQRRKLIDELADLVRGTRPRDVAHGGRGQLSEAPPEVKVVLSLREDFYANLEELRDRIPSIYKAPYRLKPLSRAQAECAIVEPAELEGEHFRTPAFSWSPEALSSVLDFLAGQQLGEGRTQVGEEVEPFQLQLICQHVEEQVSKGGLARLSSADLGGADALKAVLSNFYEATLRRICERFPEEHGLRQRLERLCEYGFITARGRRLLREESTIKQDDGVGPEILRQLVELRLLRKEPRVGDNYYELTHDTLIEPIQLSRQAREAREAREAQAAQRRFRRQILAGGVFATFVLAVTGTWALWEQSERQRIDEAKQAARAAQLKAEQEAERALAAKQKALAEKEASVKVAVKAKLEAGEEGAKRKLAEAKAELAEKETVVHAAQKKLVEAQVQATEAEGQDYEEGAKQLVAEAEEALQVVTTQLDSARQNVLEAKTKVTIAEVKTEVVEAKTKLADVQVAVSDIEGQTAEIETEKRAIEADDVLAASDDEVEIIEARLVEVATSEAPPDDGSVETVEIEAKTELKARAKVNLAALELLATDPDITDVELARRYRDFLSSGGNELQTGEVEQIEGRVAELEQAAKDFAVLKSRDEDPDFSVCEAFDQWTAYEPRRTLGPEARHRDLRIAELDALLSDSGVVTTQQNFITSTGETNWNHSPRFKLGDDRVYVHVWVNSPRRETVQLKVRHGDSERSIWNAKPVERNPIRGERMGYHLWTWKGANAEGKHELRLYNAKNTLICRREYEIVAESP